MDDGGTRVLAEGELSLAGHLGIAQEGECHVLVVVAGLGVGQDAGHLLVVLAAQQEVHVAEGLCGEHGECLWTYLEDGFTLKLAYADSLFREQVILGFVFAQLEHVGILEFRFCCHN